MAEQGEKLSRDYIIPQIESITSDFNSQFTNTAPSESDIKTFKDRYLTAISEGIDEYLTGEFVFNVKTNGAVVIATTPPGSFPIVNYSVDGTFTTPGASTLKSLIEDAMPPSATDALTNMTAMFNAILTWLPKLPPFLAVTGSITDTTVNPVLYLSTVAGPLTTLTWPSFVPKDLADDVLSITSSEGYFVDSNGNPTGKDYRDVWDIIGDKIYQGLLANVATFAPVVGTADQSKITNGTTYTAVTTLGTIEFN